MSHLLHGIEVLLTSNEKIKVLVEGVVGDFAVHRRIWGGQMTEPGWTVTHVASGLALWTVRELPEAVRVAQWLDRQSLVPNDAEKALAWKRSMKEPERSQLIVALTAVAPRFVVQQ